MVARSTCNGKPVFFLNGRWEYEDGRQAFTYAELIEALEQKYSFECNAGTLENCVEWQELRELLREQVEPDRPKVHKVSIGRVVHLGMRRGFRPMIVTEVFIDQVINGTVFLDGDNAHEGNDAGNIVDGIEVVGPCLARAHSVLYSETLEPGKWSWPARV